jgi:hypothetical protein
VFCFAGVGCSALRPAQGTLTPAMRTKHPPLRDTTFSKSHNEKIVEQFLSFFIVALCLFSSWLS